MKLGQAATSGLILLFSVGWIAGQEAGEKQAEAKMLVGTVERGELNKEPYKTWFTEEYEAYKLNTEVLEPLTKLIADYEIEIFMSTWCRDSRREVPRFYKILDYLKYPTDKVTLVALDRAKTSPGHEEKGMNIHHVPTFILFLDQVEFGRIIESPVKTLEQDLAAILLGEVYLPNYHELEK